MEQLQTCKKWGMLLKIWLETKIGQKSKLGGYQSWKTSKLDKGRALLALKVSSDPFSYLGYGLFSSVTPNVSASLC